MTDLDAIDLAESDPGGMLAAVEDSSSQWERARAAARTAPTPPADAQELRAVVVAGMGGSGITADVAAAIADRGGTVPVIPAKGYTLPAFVGSDTLVVGVSYSGTTEETLACLEQAGDRRAPRYAVTTGGALAEMADAEGFPCAEVAQDGGGEGARQPRANLPNLTVPLLDVLDRIGVLPGIGEEIASVPDHVDRLTARWRHDVPTSDNLAKRTAATLEAVVPVFYGAQGLPAVVALRGKCQVNENAQRPAFHHGLPELDHNEIVGWSRTDEQGASFAVVELRSHADEHPRVGPRSDITAEIATAGVVAWLAVSLDGPSPLARFAGGVLFVDLVSVHLAFLAGVDPTPVAAIAELKRRLAELDR